MTFVNLVTPKFGAKHELLFNKPASGAYKQEVPFPALVWMVKKFFFLFY